MMKRMNENSLFLWLSTILKEYFALNKKYLKLIELPAIGDWLIDKKCQPAHWLGKKYTGKKLIEPINIIILDKYSKTSKAAIEKLVSECKKIGYENKHGHSSGYWGSIDNVLYPQIPNDKKMAFSNKSYWHANNHGRLIGPKYFNKEYVFIGAFSRESFKLFRIVHHGFISFNVARDDFCIKMNKSNVYKIIGAYELKNVLSDNEFTTADHDGKLTVLEAIK
jgi:hypothetical protein